MLVRLRYSRKNKVFIQINVVHKKIKKKFVVGGFSKIIMARINDGMDIRIGSSITLLISSFSFFQSKLSL